MPKSTSASPPSTSKSSRAAQETIDANLIRKKKNADAQAAFRARRQNYISTLEETVTSLESVVLQLQESCREVRNENLELRQENSRLRYESREREKYWRAFIQARRPGQPHDDLSPPPLSSPFLGHASALLPQPPEHYGTSVSYRASDPACQAYDNAGTSSFTGQETFTNQSDGDGSSNLHHDRGGKYNAYPYPIQESTRDARWQVPTTLPSGLSSAGPVEPQTQSPSYMESPSLTAPGDVAGYSGRFPTNERKVALEAVLSTAPYIFPSSSRYQNVPESIPNSRSMSPTTSASSATSLPLTSSYPLAFQDGQDRADFEYRNQSLPHCPDVSLHGGIADISLAAHHTEPVRYRLGRRADSGIEHPTTDHPPVLPQDECGSPNDDDTSRVRARRNIAHPYHRSPSPGPTPLSCTVAVIKAQAFGALRRTRTKARRATDSAAKVAQDVLEARGIGVGPTTSGKHPGLDEDDVDVGKP